MNGEPITRSQLRTLLALIVVYQRDGRATLRAIADELGGASHSGVQYHVKGLVDAGLVAYVPYARGTLRPLVVPVQVFA